MPLFESLADPLFQRLALALGLDYEGWAGLRNPDIWRLDVAGRTVRVGEP